MFTKRKLTGIARGEARQYKKVINWEAVIGVAFWGFVLLMVLLSL